MNIYVGVSVALLVRRGHHLAMAVLPLLLTACGGGGGGGGSGAAPVDPPAADAAQVCAATNPYRADAEAPTKIGSLSSEKAWLRSYMDDAYLWYREIPEVNANEARFSDVAYVGWSLQNYFNALLTPATTPSGKAKDEFSFMYPTKAWNDTSVSGVVPGYGIEWHANAWDRRARHVRVAYVEPGSPAARAGLQRGDELISADGIGDDVAPGTAEEDMLYSALYPAGSGEFHVFVFFRKGRYMTANLDSVSITKTPVPTTQVIADNGRKVGYIVFHDHTVSAEQGLIDAVKQLKRAAVDDLVLDLRYNGGGYLYIASQLAYMIAGDSRTSGKTFERLVYNRKRTAENEDTPFHSTQCKPNADWDCTSRHPLPTLNLPRVTVIASGATCSASESIINSLRGVDVHVRVIGDTTCGKPYGFTAKDNCGISYFPIEFRGVNDKGWGNYADGIAPTCPVNDDFDHALGDTEEGMLNAALYNLRTGSCDSAAKQSAQSARESRSISSAASRQHLRRGPARENRIWRPMR